MAYVPYFVSGDRARHEDLETARIGYVPDNGDGLCHLE
jgi:hypothetical protein